MEELLEAKPALASPFQVSPEDLPALDPRNLQSVHPSRSFFHSYISLTVTWMH